jgi:hypothetical protein
MRRDAWGSLTLVGKALLPLLALGVGLWGSTWGWDADSRLTTLAPYYALASYTLLLAPHGFAHTPRIREQFSRLWARVYRPGLRGLLWGVHVVLSSIALIHLFDSAALWLGSMGVLYVGYGAILLGLARALSSGER